MRVIKIVFFVIATTMALTLILNTTENTDYYGPRSSPPPPSKPIAVEKRVSRFLQQKARNPNAADHCHKDNDVCQYILEEGRNTTCCNNKCIDLEYDDKNCGACKKHCAASESCCKGECVTLAYDKRHCGVCDNKCMKNGLCIYGICDYA